MSDLYSYLLLGSATVLGAVSTISIGLLLARRTVLSGVAQAALTVASGILIVGLFSICVGYALIHRVYVPPGGMDETGAAVIFLATLGFGSASALLFGASNAFWGRLGKK